jgi:hypothetical protein
MLVGTAFAVPLTEFSRVEHGAGLGWETVARGPGAEIPGSCTGTCEALIDTRKHWQRTVVKRSVGPGVGRAATAIHGPRPRR